MLQHCFFLEKKQKTCLIKYFTKPKEKGGYKKIRIICASSEKLKLKLTVKRFLQIRMQNMWS